MYFPDQQVVIVTMVLAGDEMTVVPLPETGVGETPGGAGTTEGQTGALTVAPGMTGTSGGVRTEMIVT